MTNFSGLDNQGTGFDLDDDFDALLREAEEAEEAEGLNGEEDDNEFSDAHTAINSGNEPTSGDEMTALQEETRRENEQPAEVEASTPAPAPAAASETTASVQEQHVEDQRPAARRMHIPSLEDDLKHIQRVIRILDSYRKLNREEREVAAQFINSGDPVPNEASFVIAALSVDPMLRETMEALREAKGQEPVDRAFFVMDLSDNLLYHLGSLVAVFTDDEGDRHGSRSAYARNLVRGIEGLDGKAMGFVNATENVLHAARDEEDASH